MLTYSSLLNFPPLLINANELTLSAYPSTCTNVGVYPNAQPPPKGMYSGETPKQFSKHRRQLRDSIVQWSVYKRSLLINTELNVFV